MSEPDQLLDVLQADIVALLKSTPTLADAFIFTGSEKDLATRLNKTFGTRTNSAGGKRGLGIQVLPIFTDDAESNLPGPPLLLRCQILVIENVTLNRAAATGTLKTSSQTALNILNALHHHAIGAHALYADKKPIVPEKMEDGFEAHIVTLYAHANGLEGPGKPAQVMASMGEGGGATIAGTISPDMNGFCEEAGTYEGFPYYKTPGATGDPDAGLDDGVLLHVTGDQQWLMRHYAGGVSTHEWLGSNVSAAATPDLSEWSDDTGSPLPTGNPVITLGDEALISLDLATAGAVIYYTTDGSYPDATNGTLYEDPFASPAVGTVIRAAGYKTGLNPGDCCEFVIRDGQGNIPDGEELPDFNEIFNTALTD